MIGTDSWDQTGGVRTIPGHVPTLTFSMSTTTSRSWGPPPAFTVHRHRSPFAPLLAILPSPRHSPCPPPRPTSTDCYLRSPFALHSPLSSLFSVLPSPRCSPFSPLLTFPHRDPTTNKSLGHEQTAKMCARYVNNLPHCPDQPPPSSAPTPPPSLAHFIAYALHRTRLTSSVTFAALYLAALYSAALYLAALYLLQRLKTPTAISSFGPGAPPSPPSATSSIPSENSSRQSSVKSYPTPTDVPQLPTPPSSHSNVPSPANSMSPATPPNYEGDSAKIVSSATSKMMQISGDNVSPPYHHVHARKSSSPILVHPITVHINHHSHPTFKLMQLFLTTLRTEAQHKFCVPTLRNLKKSKDARLFLTPIDVVAMNIPHYPEITHPMDFSTIERKLNFSSPIKPNPNPENPRYQTADQFIADVRLVFTNCVKFNGPEHAISLMGRRVEELFDKSIKNLPPPEEVKPPPVKKAPPPPAPAPPVPAPTTSAPAKQRAPHRPSTSSAPVIRRNKSISAGGSRPKREIHLPPSKDLPYADVPKKSRKARAVKDNLNAEQLKFCSKLLGDLHRKSHWNIASPFYEPVGTSTLESRDEKRFLTTILLRLGHTEHSNVSQDHQGAYGPIEDAEEVGRARVPQRPSVFQ